MIIYDNAGEKLEGENLKYELEDKQRGILGAYPNKSFEEWDINIKTRYNKQVKQERIILFNRRGTIYDHGGMSANGISFLSSLVVVETTIKYYLVC